MFMIPLPDSPDGYQDFAAVTPKQKRKIDITLLKQAKKRGGTHLLLPEHMRTWLEKLSYDNCGERFMRMHDMQSGGTYHGHICLLHIVSIVDNFHEVQQLPGIAKLDDCT